MAGTIAPRRRAVIRDAPGTAVGGHRAPAPAGRYWWRAGRSTSTRTWPRATCSDGRPTWPCSTSSRAPASPAGSTPGRGRHAGRRRGLRGAGSGHRRPRLLPRPRRIRPAGPRRPTRSAGRRPRRAVGRAGRRGPRRRRHRHLREAPRRALQPAGRRPRGGRDRRRAPSRPGARCWWPPPAPRVEAARRRASGWRRPEGFCDRGYDAGGRLVAGTSRRADRRPEAAARPGPVAGRRRWATRRGRDVGGARREHPLPPRRPPRRRSTRPGRAPRARVGRRRAAAFAPPRR